VEEPFVPDAYDKLKPVHLKYAHLFLRAAIALDESSPASAGGLDMDPPVYFLSALGSELTFKACLAYARVPSAKIEKFRHNLEALLSSVRANATCTTIVHAAETEACAKWRDFLRSSRDEQLAKVRDPIARIVLTDEVPSNADISAAIPRFVDAIKWLSDRYKDKGGTLRYVRTGSGHRLQIDGFGLEVRAIPRTVCWVCEHILQRLENDLRRMGTAETVEE